MQERINVFKTDVNAYQAIMALENYIDTTQINKTHRELIKIRASQINKCAYCLDMHTHDARTGGETEQRIYTLDAWRETTFFTEEERAILALTEEVTLITNGGVSNETYENAVRVLGEKYYASVLMAIVAINAWNRIGVTSHLKSALRKA
ncbi:carboxymuconolactone decarboxylase family protein [Taibaiella lutea]|uniref:Carboxymuconolactone decarboxylase family protein n=1 Tax=Taibaiella lutea TaxID=2608001 RepID=A0A5M6CIB5_9BACT|nr:carboxymuconolactone decarboxylase family protein [Taibaiella lutea]KAA5533692.1 carboxymuconolactone decarboxylase family protein [Taibaiella lutea]